MSEPSAPKPIPSSRRLRMADQNRACRLLREAIPGDVSRRALSWRVVWLHLLSHGAGRAAQPEHCVLYERWILVTQRESLSQSRESKSSRALYLPLYTAVVLLYTALLPLTLYSSSCPRSSALSCTLVTRDGDSRVRPVECRVWYNMTECD